MFPNVFFTFKKIYVFILNPIFFSSKSLLKNCIALNYIKHHLLPKVSDICTMNSPGGFQLLS